MDSEGDTAKNLPNKVMQAMKGKKQFTLAKMARWSPLKILIIFVGLTAQRF